MMFIRRPSQGEASDIKKTSMLRGGMLATGCGLLVMAGLSIGDAPADDAAQVTTDTLEYCGQLHAEVREKVDVEAGAKIALERASVLAEAESLADEGGRLCAAGKVRGGIIRLRRALSLMHNTSSSDTSSPGTE